MAFPSELCAVHPSPDTAPFWDACRRRELRFQRCRSCGRFRHPPLPGCPHCGSTEVEWVRVGGRGRVFSYTVIHHPSLPALAEHVPYNVVLVEFDDAPGVRLISNLIDEGDAAIEVGMPVELVWDEPTPGVVLARFRRG
jgi:hypothetical protein